MIFKKLLQEFIAEDISYQTKFEIAQKITEKFNFKICEQLSDDELKITIQGILFIIFMSHGLPPTASLLFSEILSVLIICKIKKAEEVFDYFKAKYVSE